MNESKAFCEYIVKPDTGASGKFLKIGLIAAYSLFTAAYVIFLYFIMEIWMSLLLLPFIMLAIFNLTWRYTQLEYEVAIEAGTLTISKIYGGRSRRTVFSSELSEALRISALTDRAVLSSPNFESAADFSLTPDSGEAWYIIFPGDNGDAGKQRAVVLETTEQARYMLRTAKPSVYVK